MLDRGRFVVNVGNPTRWDPPDSLADPRSLTSPTHQFVGERPQEYPSQGES